MYPVSAEAWSITRISAVVTLGVAMLFSNVLPALIGVLSRDLGFTPEILGALGTASMLASAAGTFAAVTLSKRVSPRAMVSSGLILFIVANLSICLVRTPVPMIAISAVAGVGSGLAVSACYYVFGLVQQERNTAGGMLSQTVFATVVITAIPVVTRLYDWRAMYVCFVVCALPCLALATYFPKSYLRETPSDPTKSNDSQGRQYLSLLPVVLSVIAIIMVWTYLDRMGAQAGVPRVAIDRALSLSTFLGAFSAMLVIWGGRRLTTARVLGVCVIVNLAGTCATAASQPVVYISGVIFFYLSLPIYLAGQFGITMRGVQSKRFATQYSLAMHAAAVAPILGGYIARDQGFVVLRAVAMLMMLLSFSLLWVNAARLERRNDTPASLPTT